MLYVYTKHTHNNYNYLQIGFYILGCALIANINQIHFSYYNIQPKKESPIKQ